MRRLLAVAALVAAFVFLAPLLAHAHSWYSDRTDPVTGVPCCGGNDCAKLVIEPGVLTAEADGYRIRLTLEQSRRINPFSHAPVDALVIWDRVQESADGNYHICISPDFRTGPRGGIFCFFAPPNT